MARSKKLHRVCSLVCGLSLSLPALSNPLAGTAWEDAGREAGIDPFLIYALAIRESGKKAEIGVAPYPYTLRYGNTVVRATSWQEFITAVEHAVATREAWEIDVGAMQTNLHHMGHHGDWRQLADPETNIRVGATNLAETIKSAGGDLELGVGRYFNWKNEEAARAYGRQVLSIYQQIKLHFNRGGA